MKHQWLTFGFEARLVTMAADCSSVAQRRIGWAYGQLVNRVDVEGATVFETLHSRPIQVPRHEHEYPYITVLLRGRYREPYRRGESYFIPFSAVFHPVHARHSGIVDEVGGQFFTLELGASWMDSMHTEVPADSVFDWHGERILWPMLRLLREYRAKETQ